MRLIFGFLIGGVVGCLIAPFAVDFVTSFIRNQWLSLIIGVGSGGFLGGALASLGGGANQFDGTQGRSMAGGFVGGCIAGGICAFYFRDLLSWYGEAFRELQYGIT